MTGNMSDGATSLGSRSGEGKMDVVVLTVVCERGGDPSTGSVFALPYTLVP